MGAKVELEGQMPYSLIASPASPLATPGNLLSRGPGSASGVG